MYPDSENEGDNEQELTHLADGDFCAVHRDDDMIQLDIWSKGICLIFSGEEWADFKKIMWRAFSNDTKR